MKQDMEVGAAFEKAYGMLNTAQKEAVDTIEGPVMVIAGPGTGKTQILTLRIANILLKTDAAPESILALTFTESGAKAMRERLRQYIGARAYRIPIYTFHGFCGGLIGDYPDSYDTIIGGKIANDLDKISIIETILDGGEVKQLRPMGNPAYYIPHIIREISTLKQEYVTPDKFLKIIEKQAEEMNSIERVHEKGAHKGKVRGEYTKKEKAVEKNRELLYVYRQYEALMRDRHLYDYDDMIVKTIEALEKNEDMLRDLQEQYQYVLADEHQDVNGSQNRILELLTSYHESPNIFVVGDEKQAIYRFQGASLENFLYFEDVYHGTKTISLTENYRSGQTVLDTAHSLVAVEEGPLRELRVPLAAAAVSSSDVRVAQYSHQAVEHDALVAAVQASIEKGTPLSEIAVIVRTNREVEQFAALLRSAAVPVTASADSDILTHPVTIAVSNLIDAITRPEDRSALFTVLHGAYWGIATADLVTLFGAQTYTTPLPALIADPEKLRSLNLVDLSSVTRVHEVLERARTQTLTDSPQRVLASALEASGFLDAVMAEDGMESARVLRRLYDEIESIVNQDPTTTLPDIARAFTMYREHGIALSAPYIAHTDEAVQVMTAHKSKGLEFETVFIPHLTDNTWGGKKRRVYFDIPLTRHEHDEYDAIDDERRLFYVALTRAKQHICLTYADTNVDGKELVVSRLCEELDHELISVVSTDREEQSFDLVASLRTKTQPSLDRALFGTVLKERGFSATSLNNYLKSPWDYFYRNVLRIPEVQPPHMQFGTAIHGVLEQVSRQHTVSGVVPNDTELKKLLEQQLQKLPLSHEEYVRLHEKGFETLLAYVPHMQKGLPKKTEEEKKVRVILKTGIPELPELPLTGMFDRLDFAEDDTLLRVVDYKTGKPKTRNVIEGKTQSSDGGYKRQLIFYALLLSLYDDDRYETRDTMLSFVEPDSKGVIHEEVFSITEDEIAELKVMIIDAAHAILAGTWFSETIEDGSTDYAHLARLLQERF